MEKDMTEIFDKNGKPLECQCGCGLYFASDGIIKILSDFLNYINNSFGDMYNLKLYNHSFCRCQKHNKAEGGYDKIKNDVHKVSLHVPIYFDKLQNKKIKRNINACDFHIEGLRISTLWKMAQDCHGLILTGGLGFYNSFIHVDNGSSRTFDYRS